MANVAIVINLVPAGSQLVSKPRLTPLELAVDKSTTEKVEEKPKAD